MQQSGKYKPKFSPQDVEIISKERLYNGFFSVIKYCFRHKLFAGGWSANLERELLERGYAASVLPYDPETDQVVLIEQIRVGAVEHACPWQLEIIAGMIDLDESSEDVIRREAREEAGIDLGCVKKLTSYYPSPGGCSEKLDVFVGQVDALTAKGIHGLDYEGEDINVLVVDRAQAYHWIEEGVIQNGASIIALQWLELNHQRLKVEWRK